MSSKNNVNKDFYVQAGRDRPNELMIDAHRLTDETPVHRGGARPNFIPGAAPVGESPAVEAPAPEAQTSAGKSGTRSGSKKRASAPRDGKARPKAGASGDARRPAPPTATATRATTRADANPGASKPRRRAA